MLGSTALLLTSWLVLVQDEAQPPAAAVAPPVVMNYFAGDWQCIEPIAKYRARMTSEWDLHHNVLVGKCEFYTDTGNATIMMIKVWDAVDKKLREKHFTSWGVFRDAEYDVVPQGEFFKLVGSMVETTGSEKRTADLVVEVADANHFTWKIQQRTGERQSFVEYYTRGGSLPVKPADAAAGGESSKAETSNQAQAKDEQTEFQRQLDRATVLQNEQKWSDAVPLLEAMLVQQREVLGEGHEKVTQIATKLSAVCRDWAWAVVHRHGSSSPDLDQAVKMAERANELTPDDTWNHLVGFAKYRKADWSAAMDDLRTSLSDPKQSWPGQWYVLSMICCRSGNSQQARDWFAATSEWMKNHGPEFGPNLDLRQEAALLLDVSPSWPQNQWGRGQYVEMFTRLIDEYPNVANLYHARGSQYGRLGDWERAADDYAKAVQLDPKDFRHREAEAAVRVYLGEPALAQTACGKFVEEFRSAETRATRADVALLCSLNAGLEIDREELGGLAKESLAEDPVNSFLRLTRGATLYRLGCYEEALAVLPDAQGVYDNPKDVLLPILFRAMTRFQLGDVYTARKTLDEAKKAIQQQVASPDGPEMPHQDRPVVWCMIHSLAREAEALIAPSHDASAAATEKVAQ